MTREEMREAVAMALLLHKASDAAADAAIALVLEAAAKVIENVCHDDMTRAEEAAAIRALGEKA